MFASFDIVCDDFENRVLEVCLVWFMCECVYVDCVECFAHV